MLSRGLLAEWREKRCGMLLEDSVLKNQLYTSREKIFKSIVLLQYNRKIRKTKLTDKEIKKMMDAYFN